MSSYYTPIGAMGAAPAAPEGSPDGSMPAPTELGSGTFVVALVKDPGLWISSGLGAAIGYWGGRKPSKAIGGAAVGAAMTMWAHSPTARQMSLPFMGIGAAFAAVGVLMLARDMRTRSGMRWNRRRRRRRRTSRRRS